MQSLVFYFMMLCFITTSLTSLWLLALAFMEDYKWGLACMIFNPILLIFVVLNLDRTWKPALAYVVSFVLGVLSLLVLPFFAVADAGGTYAVDERPTVARDGVFRPGQQRRGQPQQKRQDEGGTDFALIAAGLFGVTVVGAGATGAIVLLWSARREEERENAAAGAEGAESTQQPASFAPDDDGEDDGWAPDDDPYA